MDAFIDEGEFDLVNRFRGAVQRRFARADRVRDGQPGARGARGGGGEAGGRGEHPEAGSTPTHGVLSNLAYDLVAGAEVEAPRGGRPGPGAVRRATGEPVSGCKDNPHVSFGAGIHCCLGRHFARPQVAIASRNSLPG
jgi:hypothetical protein